MKLLSTGLTDTGRVRANNQDSYICSDALKLFVVADGLGGHAGGEVASGMAKDVLTNLFSAARRSFDPSTYMVNAIHEVNRKIYDKSAQTQALRGMGTTVTALYFSYDTAYMGHVGDSRVYLIQDDSIWQLSQDHSLVSQEFAAGGDAPMRNILTRSVGYDPDVEVDLYTKKISVGETYLLCSDGLHGLVTDQEIVQIVSSNSIEVAATELIKKANQQGGDDNITVVLTKVERL